MLYTPFSITFELRCFEWEVKVVTCDLSMKASFFFLLECNLKDYKSFLLNKFIAFIIACIIAIDYREYDS